MDLWKEFEIGERMADMWGELGLSAGTAVVVLVVLYFVIKWAVRNGIKEAYKEILQKNTQDTSEKDKVNNASGFSGGNASRLD